MKIIRADCSLFDLADTVEFLAEVPNTLLDGAEHEVVFVAHHLF
jgi:hypothetical protein